MNEQLKALLVEDDDLTAKATESALVRAGFEVQVVSTGAAAIGAMTYYSYSLAVVDLKLPDISGPDLIRALRETVNGRFIKMLVLTGTDQRSDLQAAYRAGADTVIEKSQGMDVISAKFEIEARALRDRLCLADKIEQLMKRVTALEDSHATILGLTKAIEVQTRKIDMMYDDMLLPRLFNRCVKKVARWTVTAALFAWKHKLWVGLATLATWWQTGVWVMPK